MKIGEAKVGMQVKVNPHSDIAWTVTQVGERGAVMLRETGTTHAEQPADVSMLIGIKHKPEEYVAVAVWNRYMGGMAYYGADEQQRCSDGFAPLDAIFYRDDAEGWRTVSGLVENHDFRRTYAKAIEDQATRKVGAKLEGRLKLRG